MDAKDEEVNKKIGGKGQVGEKNNAALPLY
jgi:hypothetical protein